MKDDQRKYSEENFDQLSRIVFDSDLVEENGELLVYTLHRVNQLTNNNNI